MMIDEVHERGCYQREMAAELDVSERTVRRATLADANARRDWRIHAEFAQRLIGQARGLYAGESLGLDPSNTVYALDATTIDLCLSVFPWALFRRHKAAVKLHTLLDFRRLYLLHQGGAFFVTRAKANLDARRLYSAPVDRTSGLVCDQTIALNGVYSARHYPQHLRRIRYKDPERNRTLIFLTNHFDLPALTIAALYRQR